MNINDYLNCNEIINFKTLLFEIIKSSGKNIKDIYKESDIDRRLFSKIKCYDNYIPKKNTIIKICFALKLDHKEVDNLLKSAGYSLGYTTFDYIISYCLDNKIYNLDVVNDYLFTYCNAII